MVQSVAVRERKSKLFTISDSDLIRLISESTSSNELLRKIGMNSSGRNHTRLKERLKQSHMTVDHYREIEKDRIKKTAENYRSGELIKKTVYDYLVIGSEIQSSKLKKKIISAKLLPNVCAACNIGHKWNGMPLTLQLDHINGNNRDNRLENLRILCPNCHSQTDTYSKNIRYKHI